MPAPEAFARAAPAAGASATRRARLWAPAAGRVELLVYADPQGRQLIERRAMKPLPDGWHEAGEPLAEGAYYRFGLPDGLAVPDPASRFQPADVHGASQWILPPPPRGPWRIRPWHEQLIYELHVGTFTEAGTFRAAIDRLDELAELGVTAIELMPIAEFPGRCSWGYDGVLPFAPDASYGTPADLVSLVDAAHERGLAVLLDVVYNHFGPDGNFLHCYAPGFFDAGRCTPWGQAIAFDTPAARPVRDFFIENAVHWVRDYGFDGLRLDAVHAILDESGTHLVREIARRVAEAAGPGRTVFLLLENEDNAASLLEPDANGTPGATAQWNDDFHNALHVLLTGERDGYYADFADDPAGRVARALAEGFVFQGEPSALRGGRARGEPSAHLPATAFVNFAQNHDQVGNRVFGERLGHLLHRQRPRDAGRIQRLALATLVLAPGIPMLFMGEEFDSDAPFLYFCDHGGELGAQVRAGRRREFADFIAAAGLEVDDMPDPIGEASFAASRISRRARSTSGSDPCATSARRRSPRAAGSSSRCWPRAPAPSRPGGASTRRRCPSSGTSATDAGSCCSPTSASGR
jgi:maltooligosyltrehalose trehalohydrolase